MARFAGALRAGQHFDPGLGSPLERAMAARSARAATPAFNPLVVKLVAFFLLGSLAVPSDLVIPLGGGFALTASRIAVCAMLVPVVFALARKIASDTYVLVLSDIFILICAGSMLLSIAVNHGIAKIMSIMFVQVAELAVGYFAGRIFFGNPRGAAIFAKTMVGVMAAIVVLALCDSLTSQHIVGKISSIPFGTPRVDAAQYRMGFVRARGSFEHAILLGAFSAATACLLFHSLLSMREKLLGLALCFVGVVLALSSAPMLGLALCVMIVTIDKLLSRAPWRWKLLITLAISTTLILMALSDSPLRQLIKTFTLDPSTGFFRILIWEWGSYNVAMSPWVGLGMNDWVRGAGMPSSIDAMFLAHAVRFGLPSAVTLGLAVLTCGIPLASWNRNRRDPQAATFAFGLNVTLFVMMFICFTVHYWGAMWVYMALVIGMRAGFAEHDVLFSRSRLAGARAGMARYPTPAYAGGNFVRR